MREVVVDGVKYVPENDPLKEAWEQRDKLRAEGDKLRAEGSKLYAEGDKLRAEGSKLYAGGSKLRAEGDKLYAEGSKLYAEGTIQFLAAVIEHRGNVTVKWTTTGCELGGGEVFTNA